MGEVVACEHEWDVRINRGHCCFCLCVAVAVAQKGRRRDRTRSRFLLWFSIRTAIRWSVGEMYVSEQGQEGGIGVQANQTAAHKAAVGLMTCQTDTNCINPSIEVH
jgi:hypothetical protein